MTLTGDTGSGKTTVANVLLHARGYTLALRSKDDATPLPGARIKSAKEFGIHDNIDRYLLFPPKRETRFDEYWQALDRVWEQSNRHGGWCVYFDETWAMSRMRDGARKMEERIEEFLTQGRSKKISVVCGVQRPRDVSRFVFAEPTHILSFNYGDKDDLKRLAETTSRPFAELVDSLPRYHFGWFYRPGRGMWSGTVKDLLPK